MKQVHIHTTEQSCKWIYRSLFTRVKDAAYRMKNDNNLYVDELKIINKVSAAMLDVCEAYQVYEDFTKNMGCLKNQADGEQGEVK